MTKKWMFDTSEIRKQSFAWLKSLDRSRLNIRDFYPDTPQYTRLTDISQIKVVIRNLESQVHAVDWTNSKYGMFQKAPYGYQQTVKKIKKSFAEADNLMVIFYLTHGIDND